jgi:transcriptional regulator with XRE-family HTH domain
MWRRSSRFPVGRLWRAPERFVRGVEQSAGRERDVITTRLDVGKTSPLRCLPSWDVLTRSTVGMANDRLRTALLQRGLTPAELADAAGVDPKTVERWIGGRIPYRRHRYLVATRLQADETYLWPDALAPSEVAEASESEILTVYPHRWAVPRDAWGHLFGSAEKEIGVLVYSGLFLAEDTGLHALLASKAAEGVSVRFLLGDPDSPHVDTRGQDEGIDAAMAAKIRNVIVLYRALRQTEGVQFRVHSTVLYNSIYRADNELLVNPHVYGAAAAQAPVMHLRRVAGGGMVRTYLDSFEQVWSGARPLD